MRPDQEHAARTLASVVLEGARNRDEPTPGMRETIMPTLRLDIRGLVRGMSRQVMIDSAEIARLMSEEWERQAGEINLAAEIATEVRRQIAELRGDIRRRVAEHIRKEVERAIEDRAGSFAKQTATRAIEQLIAAAVKAER